MDTTLHPTAPKAERLAYLAGCAMTVLFTLFMVFDAVIKLIKMKIVADTLIPLGYDAEVGFPLGVMEAILLALYLYPRTAILGAVLLTGLFGGAVATHLRVGSPLFSHILFGIYLGVLAWGGLWLRDAKLRAVFPLRR
ncbi:MAG: hypothetical protein JWM91_874 [Rhodospirillales bacterium]|nr:hypothetical protein [Rhodospirillales bacterium]